MYDVIPMTIFQARGLIIHISNEMKEIEPKLLKYLRENNYVYNVFLSEKTFFIALNKILMS